MELVLKDVEWPNTSFSWDDTYNSSCTRFAAKSILSVSSWSILSFLDPRWNGAKKVHFIYTYNLNVCYRAKLLALTVQTQIYNIMVVPMITAPSTLPAIPAVAARPAYWAETKPDDDEAEEVAAAELSPDVLVAVVFGEVSVKQLLAFAWHLVESMGLTPEVGSTFRCQSLADGSVAEARVGLKGFVVHSRDTLGAKLTRAKHRSDVAAIRACPWKNRSGSAEGEIGPWSILNGCKSICHTVITSSEGVDGEHITMHKFIDETYEELVEQAAA